MVSFQSSEEIILQLVAWHKNKFHNVTVNAKALQETSEVKIILQDFCIVNAHKDTSSFVWPKGSNSAESKVSKLLHKPQYASASSLGQKRLQRK